MMKNGKLQTRNNLCVVGGFGSGDIGMGTESISTLERTVNPPSI